MTAWSCPICNDTNPACLVMTCEERRRAIQKRRRPLRQIKNVTPKKALR